jgi:dihydroorotate dehydrogenase (NAD+) catalytic subunit
MADSTVTIGKKQVRGRFVIPSGIRCTRASTIAWCFAEVPSVGIVTTKSISLQSRAGYFEPIYAKFSPGSYINAVGLSNPGADQFRRELGQIRVPADKFLLVSIFGGDTRQFVETAQALASVADGFELNMSCPHAEGYGVEIGQKRELVAEITSAVAAATGLPVIVKLSAVVTGVGLTAKAAVAAGAAGITVSNTVGPGTVMLGYHPILSNKVGGLSGTAIRPLALRSVQAVRDAVGQGPLLIGMGGISTAEDVRQFLTAGADVIGIGSAVTGMDSSTMKSYFQGLSDAVDHQAPEPRPTAEIHMSYTPARVVGRVDYHEGLFKLVLNHLPISGSPGELAGKYFFLFVPGVGEKPFAIFSAEEKSIVIRVAGRFTQYLSSLRPGSEMFLRGPYGKRYPEVKNRTVVLLGGGTGIASLLEFGSLLGRGNDIHFLLGGRTNSDLFDLEKFRAFGPVHVSTNDGSSGVKGFVSDLLQEWLRSNPSSKDPVFIACGPEPMVEACFRLLTHYPAEDTWGAIEYTTSCGVGICGKCASPGGDLTCIDGPFMTRPHFAQRT